MDGDMNLQPILNPADVAMACNSMDDSVRINFSDAVVVPVGKVKISPLIEHHAERPFDASFDGHSTVTAISRHSVACLAGDYPARIYLANAMTGLFDNIQGAVRADGESTRRSHPSFQR